MTVYERLLKVQEELKAPKGQYNSFGKYKYRSAEDILEAVKPIAHKHGGIVLLSDNMKLLGDRYYIEAIATFVDVETSDTITTSAYARESLDKKGMDDSQITGTASSYARKYAMNGLFAIDDTKDADTDEYANKTSSNAPAPKKDKPSAKITEKQLGFLKKYLTDENTPKILAHYKVDKLENLTVEQGSDAINVFKSREEN